MERQNVRAEEPVHTTFNQAKLASWSLHGITIETRLESASDARAARKPLDSPPIASAKLLILIKLGGPLQSSTAQLLSGL